MANQEECSEERGKDGVRAKLSPNIINSVNMNRGVQRWKMLSSVVKSKMYNPECQNISNHLFSNSNKMSNNVPNINLNHNTIVNLNNTASSVHSTDTKRTKNDGEVQFETLYNMINFARHQGTSDWIEAHWNQELFPSQELNLRLKMLPKQFSLDEIAGFDNSGNVRLWPCEELLAYLCSFGMIRERLQGSIVCELGAGMTALAGLISAKYGRIRKIILSDGNERSVDNIREIVAENFPYWTDSSTDCPTIDEEECKNASIDVRRIRWENCGDYADLCHSVDTIICADCLFVPKYHQHLLNTLDNLLVLNPSPRVAESSQESTQKSHKATIKMPSFQEQIYLSTNDYNSCKNHKNQANHSSTNAISCCNSDSCSSSGLCDSSSSLNSDSRSNHNYESCSNHYDSSSHLDAAHLNAHLNLNSSSNNNCLFSHHSFASSSPSLCSASSSSASSSTSALYSSSNGRDLCSSAQVFIVAPQRDTTLESFIRLVRLDGRFRCLVLDHFDQQFFANISEMKTDLLRPSNFSIGISDDFTQHPYPYPYLSACQLDGNLYVNSNNRHAKCSSTGFSSRDSTSSSDESNQQFCDHLDGNQHQLVDTQRPFLLILTRN